MRYWLDTEFIESGSEHPIDLISIGIVCEDGRELYLQSCEFNPEKASEWVKENVLAHLEICSWSRIVIHTRRPYLNDVYYHVRHGQCVDQHRGLVHNCPWRTREQLKRDIQSFFNPSDRIELWGWCAGYDWVAFCQLFGTMMDLPAGYPHYVHDIQQVLDERGITDDMLPQQEISQHHALADARWLRHLWQFLKEYKS